MARIEETIFIVKLSELVKEKSVPVEKTGFDQLPASIESMVQGLVADGIVVEVERVE